MLLKHGTSNVCISQMLIDTFSEKEMEESVEKVERGTYGAVDGMASYVDGSHGM